MKQYGTSRLIADWSIFIIRRVLWASSIGAISTFFLTYALGMGNWTVAFFNNIHVEELAYYFLNSTVSLGLIYNGIIIPIAGYFKLKSSFNHALLCSLLEVDESDLGLRSYYKRLLNNTSNATLIARVMSAAVAYALYRPLVGLVNSPVASIIVLTIAFHAHSLLVIPTLYLMTRRLKSERPENYARYEDLLSSGIWEEALMSVARNI